MKPTFKGGYYYVSLIGENEKRLFTRVHRLELKIIYILPNDKN